MDTLEDELPSPMNKSVIEQVDDSNANPVHEFGASHDFTDHNFFPVNSDPSDNLPSLPGVSTEVNFPERSEASNAILKYISEMLMEEEEYLVNKPCMLQECLALQAAEKSLHDVIVQDQNPSSSDPLNFIHRNVEAPNEGSNHSSTGSIAAGNRVGLDWGSVQDVFESSRAQIPNPLVLSGEGEITHLKHNSSSVVELREQQGNDVSFNLDKDGSDSSNGSRSKRSHQREDEDSLDDWRRNKDPAVYADEFELPQLFDEVLLCQGEKQESNSCSPKESEKLQLNRKSKVSKGKKTRKKKLDDNAGMVDLWTLLTICAQSVASYDKRKANEQLKQIRLNSSPYGDDTQRLAHYVANGLELRLGADVPSNASLPSSEMSAADILKAYQTYITACPFQKMSNIYANQTILKQAEKATRLHIIDFGVLYGYQWPSLIQDLSKRNGGPPMLRITGVEFPQPGFRSSERVEQTGRRLANYCKRFNVPFKYNVIATNWETIRSEDIKIDRDELTVVNCLYRLKNLQDDTVTDCPRDTVLKLIRRISPDLFIHGVVNGSYNAPFFDIRFREALFHFSSLFNMFEETVPREDPQRLLYEQEVFGRDVINVIACEGPRRVERPETYKQWQTRNMRAGFRQVPSDQEILKEVRSMVKRDYHKDFSIDEDGMWMLQGWKGRIFHAISYWKPV
ncbi:scarecrow-like protein 11 [Pyrus x bretschneideri]|uniref:scarecrow-like protein 11 n=1 Tax=Pyrus x bretschneideri TaxID=225117 RepID=UPI002030952A|nr:scarecrow-like protein 11 [Pyrus x bretschneideri]